MWPTVKSQFKKIQKWQERGDDDSIRNLASVLVSSGDESLKAEAIKALGAIGGEAVVLPLVGALKSESRHARAEAAIALGVVGHPKGVDALIETLDDQDDVLRLRSAEALGKIGDPGARLPLKRTLDDPHGGVGCAAALALAKVGNGDSADALLNWIEKLMSGTAQKMSADEKCAKINAVMSALAPKLDTDQLHAMADNLVMQIRVQSWEVANPLTREPGWIAQPCQNPIWKPLQEELAKRKATESSRPAPERTPTPSKPQTAVPPPRPQSGSDSGERDFFGRTNRQSNRDTRILPMTKGAASTGESEAGLGGVIGEFLKFLESHALHSVVLIGGALRDFRLGRKPNDLDVTCYFQVPSELRQKLPDPVEWNLQFAAQAQPVLEHLASALKIGVADLLAGKAVFSSNGESLPVHYVGPYLLEEQETTFHPLQIEQRLKRMVSRLGLVADAKGDQLYGLISDATVNRMWSDYHGTWHGDWKRGTAHLNEKEIHVEGPVSRAGLLEIFRVLHLKHSLGFTLSDSAVEVLESAAQTMNADLDLARREFSREAFDRLLALPRHDLVVDELELLGLAPTIVDFLSVAQLAKVNEVIGKRETEREALLQRSKRTAETSRKTIEEKQAQYDKKREQFLRNLELLDESKSTKFDVETQLRASTERLADAEQAARESTGRLEEATRRFRAIATGENVDVTVIQAHRAALADKRDRDARVEALKKEVEGLRVSADAKRAQMLSNQNRMEELGKNLEDALQELQTEKTRAEEAGAELERIKDFLNLSPQRRRARLRGIQPS